MKVQPRGGGGAFRSGALALLTLLLCGSCNMGVPTYTMTVELGVGVTGTPPTGQYNYKELTQVMFNYQGVNEQDTVETVLNGQVRYPGTGAFIIYSDGYSLTANIIDVRGSYKIVMVYSDSSVTAPAPFVVTLVGADRFSGPFTDERGYHGNWTAQANILTLAYWDWEFYVLHGTVYNLGHNPGTFTGGGNIGTWTAVKQ